MSGNPRIVSALLAVESAHVPDQATGVLPDQATGVLPDQATWQRGRDAAQALLARQESNLTLWGGYGKMLADARQFKVGSDFCRQHKKCLFVFSILG